MGTLKRIFLTVLAALAGMLAAASPTFAAGGVALAREMTVQVYELRIVTAMSYYDENSGNYAKEGNAALTASREPMAALLKELTAMDAATGAAAVENWRVMQGSLLGGGEWGEGILKVGYDSRISADFDDNSQQLLATIDKAWNLAAGTLTPESRAYLLVARTVANYIQISASPFGAYTNSFNTEDSDLTKLVPRVDAVLGEVLKKYAADAEKSAKLKRVNAKWQFIRTTILKSGKQATPFIVYKHGGDMIRELKSFN